MSEAKAENQKDWSFVHNCAQDAQWTPGLREIFEYRDLGIKEGTKGDYIAHLIRHNGKKAKDDVKEWHVHDCAFQFVLVLNGWATFEYEGQGVKTIRKGDCIIRCPASSIARLTARTTSKCSKSYRRLISKRASWKGRPRARCAGTVQGG